MQSGCVCRVVVERLLTSRSTEKVEEMVLAAIDNDDDNDDDDDNDEWRLRCAGAMCILSECNASTNAFRRRSEGTYREDSGVA